MFFAALVIAAPVWAQEPRPLPQAAANSQQAPAQASSPQTPNAASSSPSPATTATTTAPAKSGQIVVPTGTHIPLVLHNGISTRSARAGDPVYFETLFPVMVDGKVTIPAGSYVSGEVTESKRPGRVKGRGELMIKLTTMILPNAYMVNLNASPSGAGTGGAETVNSEGKVIGDTDKASDVGTVVKSTAAGAGIGAIAGRSGEGAGIGAGIGALAGLGAVLLSRGPEAELPRGSTVEAVIDRPIFLDADKVQFANPGQASTLPGPPNREPQRSKIPF
jgi:type IV secretion system protein VirB10